MLSACSKDDLKPTPASSGSLPAETQTGANTFGCYINGNLLIPRSGTGDVGSSDYVVIVGGEYPNGNEYNEIDVHDYKSTRTGSILIHIQSLDQLGAGEYIIDESNGQRSIDGLNHNYLHCRVFDSQSNTYKFYRSFTNSGVLKITRFDFVLSVRRIISGTFTCRVRNSANPVDEIEITSGRFDIESGTVTIKNFP